MKIKNNRRRKQTSKKNGWSKIINGYRTRENNLDQH